jgi:DNA adenine methylase
MTKPIIKWVGGKTQIIDKIINKFPKEINNYYEIFLGGGSVLLSLLTKIHNEEIILHGKIYAYDINKELIAMYKNIQNDYLNVYNEIYELIKNYNSLSNSKENGQESYYYLIRKFYNDLSEEQKLTYRGSAIFIFLNKTCFRGLYRIGPSGFNVPFGNYKNPEIINFENLKDFSNLISKVHFECLNFEESMKLATNFDDFIYMDPPYFQTFDKYTKDGFCIEKHLKLFEMCKKIECKFLMSNSDNDFVINNMNRFNIDKITSKRTINSKNPESKTIELMIYN